MAVIVRQTPELSAEEQQRLFGWAPNPFGVAHLGLSWRPKDLHLLLDLNGLPVSHVGVLRHEVRSSTRSLRLAGFGGVVTVPEAQKRGYASQLMQHATHLALTDWSQDAGLLFCLPALLPYYERLGWRQIQHSVLIDQPSGRIPAPIPAMVYPAEAGTLLSAPFILESLPW